ncbi:MAG: site-specific integrase [Lachnospiraceae bacterium]|nr:site-specific integrase [Lachnospiraceae bacterium]
MPIYKDEKTGNWYVKCYYQDYTGTKKQKLKRGFKLQREAKEWERSFLEKMQGTPDMTFQALYDLYIEDMSHRLRQTSIEGKKNVFKNRILPYFKDKPVNAITPADVRAWQNVQISQGYSDAYLDRIQNMLTTILNYAVKYYNLPSNPCDRAGHMGKRTRSQKFWTVDEFNKVMASVTDPSASTALQLLFYSGMRFGELLALTLQDFDFEANTINITKSLQHRAKAGDIVTPPKTDNGIRCISMPPAIMQTIKGYTERIYGISAKDRVFTFTKSLISGNMKRGAAAAGLPIIRIHDIRHSHVSLLIDMGFSPHLIAERIGDTVQMVNNTYGHLYPTKHKEVADKLNELLVSN